MFQHRCPRSRITTSFAKKLAAFSRYRIQGVATLDCHPLPVVSLWNYVYPGSLFPKKKEKRETRVKLGLIFISFIPLLFSMIKFFLFFPNSFLGKTVWEKKILSQILSKSKCLRKIIHERARTSFQTRYRFVKKGVFSGKVLHSQMYSSL